MEITTLNPKLMVALTDKELIQALCAAKDKQNYDALYTQFFHKFKGYVFKTTVHLTRNFNNSEDLAKDITQETFSSIYQNKPKFKFPENASENECTARIKSWLSKSAKNQFRKEYAKRINIEAIDEINSLLPESVSPPPELKLVKEHSEEDEIEITNQFMLTLVQALGSIKNERDKHILFEYAMEGCIESKLHLTPNTMEYLCKLYNTTPENIRQIKSRTYRKLKSLCFQNKN